MVAGVGSIDLALLVVAADDGWMPQTEEHLHILTYLGVTRAVVALTKCDLTDPDAAGKALRQHLQGSIYADAPIVPTSCLTGLGLGELRACLAGELAKLPPPQDIGKPRLAVDRAFSLRGLGTADLDGVAYTAGPGLVGALMVGAATGRALAWALDLPAVGVHHMEGHLLAPLLEDPGLAPPFVALLVSGGHTQLVEVAAIGD